MEHKYVLLKSSWGIVIFLEVEEIKNSENTADKKITDKIFLRVNDSIQLDKKHYESWIVAGIKDLADKIHENTDGSKVCFLLKISSFILRIFKKKDYTVLFKNGWSNIMICK